MTDITNFWMSIMVDAVRNLNLPTLAPLPRRYWWVVVSDWKKHGFTVPKNFATDLDSVPRIPGLYAMIKGRSVWAALLHDYLYATGEVSRECADLHFYNAMKEEGVPRYIAWLMHRSVRMVGWRYYKKQRKRSQDFLGKAVVRRMVDATGHAPCFDRSYK